MKAVLKRIFCHQTVVCCVVLAGLMLLLTSCATKKKYVSESVGVEKQALISMFVSESEKNIDEKGYDNSFVHLTLAKPINSKEFTITQNHTANTINLTFDNTLNKAEKSTETFSTGLIKSYLIKQNQKTTSVLIKLTGPVIYKVNENGEELVMSLNKRQLTMKEKDYEFNHVVDGAHYNKSKLNYISFHDDNSKGGEVIFSMSNASTIPHKIKSGKGKLTIFLPDTTALPAATKLMDLSAYDGVISKISTKNVKDGALVTLYVKGDFKHHVNRYNNKLILNVRTDYAPDAVSQVKKKFKGKHISLNFQNISVRALLKIISDFTKSNMIISASVTGNTSISLNNVPWDQALDIILKTQNLEMERIDGVAYIAPKSEIVAKKVAMLQEQQQIAKHAKLYSEVFSLHYSNAEDMLKVFESKDKGLLSPRGQVSADLRTNSLWFRDTANQLKMIRKLIKQLDVPVQQVLIEAKIVTIDKNYEFELGAKLGVTRDRLTGTLAGSDKILNGTAPSAVPVAERLNFDLAGAKIGSYNPATTALALFKITDKISLDLELSALEYEGKTTIISTPRVMTLSRKPALIQTGEEIPYEESTSSGATNVTFKKAVLSLKVTPQITPDNRILMDLQVKQDKRSLTVEVKGVPVIETQEVASQVLLSHGETIVLGGVYKKTKGHGVTRVPFFSSIPLIGELFKHRSKVNAETELLIFLTPRIVESTENRG